VTLQKAQRLITCSEACSEDAEFPFENILDRVTGSDPSVTNYVMEGRGVCSAAAMITERTLVEPACLMRHP
jgi:hypothetical protein